MTTAMADALIGNPDPEIVNLEERLREAQLNADTNALDELIADELLFTGPDGQIGSKAQDIESHRSGVVRFRSHEPIELRIRRVGVDVAIVNLKAKLEVRVSGDPVSGTFVYTRVWAREHSAAWRVVGGHVSPVG